MELNKIQQALKVPKSQYNSFGKYHYRNAEDILEAVKPLLGESILTLSDEVVCVGNRNYVKATATFIDAGIAFRVHTDGSKEGRNAGTTSVTAYACEAEERKGMDSSQITGAASSYARKYALNGLFLIDDTKDADHDEGPAPKKVEAREVKEEDKEDIEDALRAASSLARLKEIWGRMTPEERAALKEVKDEIKAKLENNG